MDKKTFTTPEAAEYLGISPITLFRYREAGKLVGEKVNSRLVLYTRAELDAFLETHGQRKRGRPRAS